jgi:hypothetical protein
MFAQQ